MGVGPIKRTSAGVGQRSSPVWAEGPLQRTQQDSRGQSQRNAELLLTPKEGAHEHECEKAEAPPCTAPPAPCRPSHCFPGGAGRSLEPDEIEVLKYYKS